MARLVVCSLSAICHSSGRRELKTNESKTKRNVNRRIDFTTVAENVRASTALRAATAAQAVRLHRSTAAKSWNGGVIIAPCHYTSLSVAIAVSSNITVIPHPKAIRTPSLPRM